MSTSSAPLRTAAGFVSGVNPIASSPSVTPAPGQVYEPSKDPDCRTEVGGPPTGQVPKSELTNPAVKRYQAQRRLAGYRAGIWIVIAAGFAAAGALATWQLTRPRDNVSIAAPLPPPPDHGIAESKGTLEIDSNPSGAIVTVEVLALHINITPKPSFSNRLALYIVILR